MTECLARYNIFTGSGSLAMDYETRLGLALLDPALQFFGRPGFVVENSEEPAAIAAYRLVAELGRCWLFGVDLRPVLTLPSQIPRLELVLTAAETLIDRMVIWRNDVTKLSERWEGNSVIGWQEARWAIGARMEAWAVAVVVMEVRDIFRRRRPLPREHEQSNRALKQVLDSTSRFDEALQAVASYLSVAVKSKLLRSWRQSLAPKWQQILPWWLEESQLVACG